MEELKAGFWRKDFLWMKGKASDEEIQKAFNVYVSRLIQKKLTNVEIDSSH